ncbi:MAG TPA: sodium:proton antiporter [Candidatus Dormibacteraeota bacterium]|nr:sodium:proton antiporter [Candidatus Dormibacteraeota bacterium]
MDLLHILPFAAMLVGIALLPILVPHLWEHPLAPAALSAGCAIPAVADAALGGHLAEIGDGLSEYVAFIALISALYVTAGGIHISGNPRGTPVVNATFLAIGAVAASLIGTTGASMLLIRPLLDANRARRHKTHIVIFFILVVSNTGGLLTPLGDPPLYLGYLNGVPFFFTLRLFPAWLLAQVLLLTMFVLWDSRVIQRESGEDLLREQIERRALKFDGTINIALALAIIVISAAGTPSPWREVLFAAVIGTSLAVTPARVREANTFHYGPLREVALLFLGIFITMVPALEALRHQAPHLPVGSPTGLFLLSGLLSSVLDNAPTYLIFANLAAARAGVGGDLGALAAHAPALLAAVSIGSVFMGANTYIGNGPNLLVKAVAESAGSAKVAMPNFIAYAGYAIAILTPVYLAVLIFIL